MRSAIIALALGAFMSAAAQAAENGTIEEAKVMVAKAVTQLELNGPEQTFAVINDKTGPFVDRDLYVYVVDDSGIVWAHPISPGLIGKHLAGLKDVDGKAFIQTVIETKDEGLVDYKWLNPQTKTIDAKTVFVKRAGKYLVCAGIYKH